MTNEERTQTDPERVGRWEYLLQNTASYWPRRKAEAVMAFADSEQAALVAEVERLRGRVVALADEWERMADEMRPGSVEWSYRGKATQVRAIIADESERDELRAKP